MSRSSIVRVAHRGASSQSPENTLLAFRQAIVTSFSSRALLWARAINAEVSTMPDPSPQDGSLTLRQICAQVLRAAANCLSYNFRYLTPVIVTECRLMGIALWPWDGDEPDDLRELLILGVHGIMTNRPDLLNKVIHDFTF